MFLDHFKKQASHCLQERFKTIRLTFTDVTPAELLAEEATNDAPCSPDAKTMTKIAAASFDMEEYWRIVDILHRKLYNVDWKDWRQSYKALVLLEFLLTHGPEDFVDEFQGDTEVIQELGSFKHIDDKGFNWGSSMQKRSEQILILLGGGPKLREARYKALKLTTDIQGFGGSLSSPSCSTPSSAYSDTPRASCFSTFSTTSSVWNELNNELSKFHQPYTPTKSDAMDSYSLGGLRDSDDDHDHYETSRSNFSTTSESREVSHRWNCPPIQEKDSLLESEEEDYGDDAKYYEKEDGSVSGICSKLVNLSPTTRHRHHGNIGGFRSVSDVGRELRKKTFDRQSSFWY